MEDDLVLLEELSEDLSHELTLCTGPVGGARLCAAPFIEACYDGPMEEMLILPLPWQRQSCHAMPVHAPHDARSRGKVKARCTDGFHTNTKHQIAEMLRHTSLEGVCTCLSPAAILHKRRKQEHHSIGEHHRIHRVDVLLFSYRQC